MIKHYIESEFDTGMDKNWCYINFILFVLSFVIGIAGIIIFI